MSLYDDLVALPTVPAPEPRRNQHPKGWEPGVVFDGAKGALTTEPLAEAPKDWSELLAVWGLDPETHEVVEPVGYRAWDGATREADGTTGVQRLFYFRANIRLRRAGATADVDELIRQVQRHKPPRPRKASTAPAEAFVVVLGDWQVGKADGDGTEGIVGRVMQAIDDVEARVKELRRAGRNLASLYVMGVGDLIEGCGDHYAQQTWRTQLTQTEQIRLARQLITRALIRWSKLFERVVVAAVQGNHGEVRQGGKSFTDFGDNHDTDVFKSAAEVLAANPEAYGHVSFAFPQGQEITLTLDVHGVVVGLAHGHQFRNGKAGDWLGKQALGLQRIGEAQVLLTGHYHHLVVQQMGPRLWLQCPALDGGSDWFRHISGDETPPGMLTLVIGNSGWRDLALL